MRRCRARRLHSLMMSTQNQQLAKTNDEKSPQPVAKKTRRKTKPATTSMAGQPVEFRKLDVSDIENSSLLDSWQLDETPLLFFGNKERCSSQTIALNQTEVQCIWKSFEHFKDIIESIKDEKANNSDFE